MEGRMGRPPKSGNGAMIERLEIRLHPGEKDSYDKAAKALKMERAEWIRHILNRAASSTAKRTVRSNGAAGS